jgi:hypothetical protein
MMCCCNFLFRTGKMNKKKNISIATHQNPFSFTDCFNVIFVDKFSCDVMLIRVVVEKVMFFVCLFRNGGF